MTTNNKAEIAARVDSITQAITDWGSDKPMRVTVALAKNFNGLLEDAKAACPQDVSRLPDSIDVNTDFASLGSTTVTTFDLSIFLRQIDDVVNAKRGFPSL